MKEGADEEKEVEQRVPTITKAPEGPRVPVAKKKYPVVLLYFRWLSEQLRRVFRSFNIPAYFNRPTLSGNYWYGPRIK